MAQTLTRAPLQKFMTHNCHGAGVAFWFALPKLQNVIEVLHAIQHARQRAPEHRAAISPFGVRQTKWD
jgi:hypothetical protein